MYTLDHDRSDFVRVVAPGAISRRRQAGKRSRELKAGRTRHMR